jgi:hypothetical protein
VLRVLAIVVALVAVVVGCVQLNHFAAPEPPAVAGRWRELLDEIRVFERQLGFRQTKNFAQLSTDRQTFPFCGQASNRRLPYSYQDPAIRWLDDVAEAKCRDVPADTDAYYGEAEAWGEINTPVTAAMVAGTIDRFVYLVIHEDCHDQFALPYGIEEPVCEIITYRAMKEFSSAAFRWYAVENRAIRAYTRTEARHVGTTIAHYEQLDRLYRRYEREEITHETLLRLRARILARAERAMQLADGQLNNINLANYMTYSRHYPYLERTIDRLGTDLAGTVEFFRQVDARKPSQEQIMQRHGISERKSEAFVRAAERAVIETIEALLRERSAIPTSG